MRSIRAAVEPVQNSLTRAKLIDRATTIPAIAVRDAAGISCAVKVPSLVLNQRCDRFGAICPGWKLVNNRLLTVHTKCHQENRRCDNCNCSGRHVLLRALSGAWWEHRSSVFGVRNEKNSIGNLFCERVESFR